MNAAESQVGGRPRRLDLPDGDAGAPLPAEPPRPRPLLVPAAAFIAGVAASAALGQGPRWLWWLAFSLPFIAFGASLAPPVRRTTRTWFQAGLLVVAALACGYARHQSAIRLPPDHVARHLGDEATLTRLAGQIVTTPMTGPAEKRNPFLAFNPPPRTRFILAARELRTTDPPTPISGYVRVSVEAEAIDGGLGDTVVVTGRLYRPRGPRNPGEMDWARWNRLQGVYAGMAAQGPRYVRRVESATASPRRLLAALRARAQGLLFEPFGQAASDDATRLLETMVLGHRSAAGRKLNEAFLRTGGMHFLAVSGFHVGVLAWAVWVFMRKLLQRSTRTTAIVMMAALLAYAAIAEPNAPILRATLVGVLGCLALLFRRQRPFCALNWLSAAALCVLVYNPRELFRAGFQLSFIQVLMLLTVLPWAYRWLFHRGPEDGPPPDVNSWPALGWLKLRRWSGGLALVCVLAWVTALPLVMYHFGRFALWGWAQAVLISPLVIATILLGLLTVVAGPLPLVGAALGTALRVVTGWLLAWVDVLSRWPNTLIDCPRPPIWLVVLSYALAGLLVWSWRGRALAGAADDRPRRAVRVSRSALGIVALAVVWTGWLTLLPRGTGPGYVAHVLSVGSGSATLVTAPNRAAALIDVGTLANFDAGETAAGAVRELAVRRVASLAISHANFDHYSGVPTLTGKAEVARILVNPYFEQAAAVQAPVRALLAALPQPPPPRAVLRAGDKFTLEGATFVVLWPPDDLDGAWRRNDRSLVIRLEAHGRSVLIPGDIERAAIRALLAEHAAGRVSLRSDVLVAPHHGSVLGGDTAAFFAAVSPQVVIVSTARERPRLVALVRETLGSDCRLISTRDAGAVTVRLTPPGDLVVETPYAGPAR